MNIQNPCGVRFEALVEVDDWILGFDHVEELERNHDNYEPQLVVIHVPCNPAAPESVGYEYTTDPDDDGMCLNCKTSKVPDEIKTLMLLYFTRYEV